LCGSGVAAQLSRSENPFNDGPYGSQPPDLSDVEKMYDVPDLNTTALSKEAMIAGIGSAAVHDTVAQSAKRAMGERLPDNAVSSKNRGQLTDIMKMVREATDCGGSKYSAPTPTIMPLTEPGGLQAPLPAL